MSRKVYFWRYHKEYMVDFETLMMLTPEASNIYECIWRLQLEEYFSCHCELLIHNQEPQIPIRWE